MAKTIEQRVTFRASPDDLFELYMDSARHSAAIGTTVSVSRDAGGIFLAFDGKVRGKMLIVVPGRMIVQTWRGEPWEEGDLDSVLVLTFTRTAGGAELGLVQANVPDRGFEIIRDGWHQHYWTPWRTYLESGRRS